MKKKIIDALTSGYVIVFASLVVIHEILAHLGYVQTFAAIPFADDFISQGLAAFFGAWAAFRLNAFKEKTRDHRRELRELNYSISVLANIRVVANDNRVALTKIVKEYNEIRSGHQTELENFATQFLMPTLTKISPKNVVFLAEFDARLLFKITQINNSIELFAVDLHKRNQLLEPLIRYIPGKDRLGFTVEESNLHILVMIKSIDERALKTAVELVQLSEEVIGELKGYATRNFPDGDLSLTKVTFRDSPEA